MGCAGTKGLSTGGDTKDKKPEKKEKPKVQKFDLKTLQPFDKILARDYSSDNWECALFSHIEKLKSGDRVLTVGSFYNMCIPYNEETKHLVGITEDCPDYYKWWKK